MKIAKKVLAVVMAVAMIACLSAMAFAADGKVVLKTTEIKDGKFNVQLVANDYADLKAANWVLTYDSAAVKCVKADNNGTGDFANIATDPVLMAAASGQLATAYNNDKAGEVQIGFAFQEQLNNAGEVVLCTLNFEVVDAAAKNVEIKLTGDNTASVVILEEKEEETTVPEETTTEAEETTTKVADETTTCCTPAETTTNKVVGPETGDTGVLAIAAGVVALAGAAFVVSKKRK